MALDDQERWPPLHPRDRQAAGEVRQKASIGADHLADAVVSFHVSSGARRQAAAAHTGHSRVSREFETDKTVVSPKCVHKNQPRDLESFEKQV